MKKLLWPVLAAAILSGAGCKEEGPAEKAGRDLDKAAEKAKADAKKAADKTGEAGQRRG